MGVIHGEMELWADDQWLNQGSAVSSVDDSDPFISECAAKRQHSGLLSAPIAGQGSLHSRATDTEERARRIDETESDEVSVQNHCLRTVCADLHHLTELASSAEFEMDQGLEQSNLFLLWADLSVLSTKSCNSGGETLKVEQSQSMGHLSDWKSTGRVLEQS